jgi:hypothetical protein
MRGIQEKLTLEAHTPVSCNDEREPTNSGTISSVVFLIIIVTGDLPLQPVQLTSEGPSHAYTVDYQAPAFPVDIDRLAASLL